jgi:hypothetical protein
LIGLCGIGSAPFLAMQKGLQMGVYERWSVRWTPISAGLFGALFDPVL